MVGQSGDLTRLQAARTTLDQACEQPRAGEAEGRSDPEEQQEVGRRILQPLPRRRVFVLDDDDRDEVAVLVQDRKSTRLNSSHVAISYAVFCLKKKITRIHVRSP